MCLIDYFEIEVQQPSKALNQSPTWSVYKKVNTIQNLVSSTPNELVNYIFPGFGGKSPNSYLVESFDFVDIKKSLVADRGFKHVEQNLHQSGITLVRHPSVETK